MSFISISPLVTVDPSLPIAGFDIDHTLIEPKRGNARADNSDPTDWKWLYDNTVSKLTELHDSGKYRVIAFTNQGSEKFDEGIYRTKIKAMQQDIPFLDVRVAVGGRDTKSNPYRKPSNKMWMDASGISTNAFYVGDAAGRYKSTTLKVSGDHDACDIVFAYNVGVPFYLPEEFFRNDYSYRSKVKALEALIPNMYTDHKDMVNKISDIDLYTDQYVLCMVGIQAAGKSTFTKNLIDLIGSNKLTMVGDDADLTSEEVRLDTILKSGLSCIVDATNPTVSQRARWIKIAKAHNIPILCVHLTTNGKMAKSYNAIRPKRISEGALNGYMKAFQEPSTSEGFDGIIKIKGHCCL